MNKVFRVTYLTISSIQDLRNLNFFIDETEDIIQLLIVDESFGLKQDLKNIVEVYFHNQEEALRKLLAFKNNLITEVFAIESLAPNTLDEIEDLFVDAIWLLEEEPQDSYEYVQDQIVALGPILISKIVYYNLLKAHEKLVWIDNRDFVLSTDEYSIAKINLEVSKNKWRKIAESIENKVNIMVIQNRVGSTLDNNTSMLGEGENIRAIFS